MPKIFSNIKTNCFLFEMIGWKIILLLVHGIPTKEIIYFNVSQRNLKFYIQ